jgi:hypothetical protein
MQLLKAESRTPLLLLVSLLVIPFGAHAQVIFTDNFNSGASASWNNESGNWIATGGVYYAQSPYGGVYSGLPFALTNFVVEVDMHAVADGGIWLRRDATGGNGVLLITGGEGWGWGARGGDAGQTLYWHVITNGNYSPYLGEVFNVFNPTVSDAHLRIVVSNDTYSAYLNGGATPISSITDSSIASGRVGLRSMTAQTFDNFSLSVIPPPPALDIQIGTVLSWPAEYTGYILEQSTNLLSPNWVAVPNPVRVVNQVVLPPPAGNRYFQLRKP